MGQDQGDLVSEHTWSSSVVESELGEGVARTGEGGAWGEVMRSSLAMGETLMLHQRWSLVCRTTSERV